MVDSVLFYISASNDLLLERDLLSRVITEIPVTLGWKIYLSPLRDKLIDENSIIEADIHLLVLGKDIRAPIGIEWYLAKIAGRFPTLFYRNNISRTPAALDFYRTLSRTQTWQSYDSPEYLRHLALTSISKFLLSQSRHFSLDQAEVENLSSFLSDLEESEPRPLGDIYGGTGDNSIIISPERYIPSSGVLIDHPGQVEDQ